MSQASIFESLKGRLPSDAARDVLQTHGISVDASGKFRCPDSQNHSHGDRNPSGRYDRAKRRAFCASQHCLGESGQDAIGLEQKLGGGTLVEAAERLAARYGVTAPSNGHQLAAKPEEPSRPAEEIRQRMTAQGWNIAQRWERGPGLWKLLLEHRTKIQPDKGRPEKTFIWEREESGLLLSGKGDRAHDVYLNRVVREAETIEYPLLGVEGERKADAMADEGISGFSTHDVNADNARAFHGADVVIIPDRDTAGERTAARAAGHIATHARSVRLVTLAQLETAGFPPKGDIVDMRERGWARAEIMALAAQAASFELPADTTRATATDRSTHITIDELPPVGAAVERFEYIREPELPAAAVVAFTGDSGSGKSTLVTAFTRDAIRGGHPCLILDRENPRPVISERNQRLGLQDGPLLRWWGGWMPLDAPMPDSPVIVDWVKRQIEQGLRPLVVVDSLIAFLEGNENDSKDVRAFTDRGRRLANLGATVVIIHHDGKSETARDFRGSSDFKGAVDQAFHVTNSSANGHLDRLALRVFKSRYGHCGTVRYCYAGGEFIREGGSEAPTLTVTEQLTNLLRTNPGIGAKKFEDLAGRHGLGRNRARDFISAGVLAGTIEKIQGSKNSQSFHLAGGEI